MQTEEVGVAPSTAEDALLRLVMAVGRRFRTRADGDDVDPSQAALLYKLKYHGAMRLGDIAEAMKLDASTVSRHVQQLGDRGLIQRQPDPQDGRASIIALTADGLVSLKKTIDQRRSFISASLSEWSDVDRERLRTDLIRLTESLGDPA
ncbi:hypothetical protein C6I20_11795 [Aeromicrobium sp. A1-2]|uniref:MarR family winged helix-turn-helix transcriptional regulator n=1 Tax=Aeromicrobium sp. A1-2 TaxID=2107713 RepID=UPI000E4FD82B|nr:MarR family transcriptional regulator [Aeromicrobium sp. A1-2]AXT85804.1 hypothetical protein C6I20_11795 [Aeromicrobium sp. A1-2]